MIAIIDFGEEHTSTLVSMLEKITSDFIVTSNEVEICRADKVILSAYGDASWGIKKLHLLNLFTVLRIIRKPMLGIDMGMHLMCNNSGEDHYSCLGIFQASGIQFDYSAGGKNKGFSKILFNPDNLLFKNIGVDDQFYFEHNCYIPRNDLTTSVVDSKEIIISSSLEKGNAFAVQFRPEESGDAGKKVLMNFLEFVH
ncbi:MAG: hypothetical protein HXY49_00515 [Ignavibacteriaceae bacterium]|nr:hypothetical protein [Ignavibacteriaceae bacterium]